MNEHPETSEQHTPGPWTYDPEFFAGNDIFGPDGQPVPRSREDRRLIAAAPDLLAALEGYRRDRHDMFACQEMGGTGRPCPTCRAARDAIAKAKGEA